MAARRSLPVIVPPLPEQRFSCHGCTACCRDLVVYLTVADRRRLDAQGWSFDQAPYVRLGPGWVLNQTADHHCVFLLEDNRCRIHAELGATAKPLVCQLYPFALLPTADGWRLSLRFDCPSVAESSGVAIAEHLPELRRLASDLPDLGRGDEPAVLQKGRPANEAEMLHLVGTLDEWLRDDAHDAWQRTLGLCRFVELLGELDLRRVHGERFCELVTLLLADVATGLEDDDGHGVAPPTLRQRRLLRQQVFTHCEAISVTEALAGWRTKAGRMISQLWRSRQLVRLDGLAPRSGVSSRRIPSAEIEAVAAADGEAEAVREVVIRYLRAQLLTHNFYGAAHYGWSAVNGLQSLIARLAVWGWLARYCAAAAGKTEIDQQSAIDGLRFVSRAAGISPALGSRSERLRLTYLQLDHGVQRLWCHHPLFQPPDESRGRGLAPQR